MKISMAGKLFIAAVLLVVAALATVFILKGDAATSLMREVETRGSRILGTRVEVSHARIDSRAGHVLLSDLTVANPPGFDRRNMIGVGEIDAQVDRTARAVKQVELRDVRVLIEFRGSRSNVETLAERVARGRAASGGTTATENGVKPEETGVRAGADERGERDDWRVQRIEIPESRVSVRADWASEVFELQTGGFSVGPLNAGTDDLVRAVVARFVDKVLVTAARGVDDDRLRTILMHKVKELRARLE